MMLPSRQKRNSRLTSEARRDLAVTTTVSSTISFRRNAPDDMARGSSVQREQGIKKTRRGNNVMHSMEGRTTIVCGQGKSTMNRTPMSRDQMGVENKSDKKRGYVSGWGAKMIFIQTMPVTSGVSQAHLTCISCT